MDATELGAICLIAWTTAGIVTVLIAAFIFWKDIKMRRLERQMSGLIDVMEDFMFVHDRELGENWEYTLALAQEVRREAK